MSKPILDPARDKAQREFALHVIRGICPTTDELYRSAKKLPRYSRGATGGFRVIMEKIPLVVP